MSRRSPLRSGAAAAAFLAPNVIGLALFTFIPVIFALVVSFTQWNLVSGIEGIVPVGLQNYVTALTDEGALAAFGRTGLYTLGVVPPSIFFGLLLALALNRPLIGRGFLRFVFFVPYIMNQIAVGVVWLLILNPTAGLLNRALGWIGIDGPAWLLDPNWALAALCLIGVWATVGYSSVIYLAALQDRPVEPYEAAAIDGAGPVRTFFALTVPLMTPTTIFLFITSIIGSSQTFGLIAYLTQGGPNDATTTVPYYMYRYAFRYYEFGYSAAIGMVLFILILVISVVLFRNERDDA